MKSDSLSLGLILSITVLGSAMPAYAGVSEMLNDFFTFREDQRPLVAPQQNVPPVYVDVPTYNTQEAEEWSSYYTRPDLKAVNYMDDSSKVMHPSQTRPNIEQNQFTNNTPVTEIIRWQERVPQGYEIIENRDRINRMEQQRRNNIYVGEAGTSPYSRGNHRLNIGQKTQIGNPVRSWKDGPANEFANSRPGDYDYNMPADDRYEMANNSDYNHMSNQQNINRSGQTNRSGPTNYTVRRNDTLTGISEQDQIYGDWKLWPLIYDANRAQVQDPDLIHPGQNLGIPRDHTDKQRQGARYRSLNKMPPHLMNDGR